MLDDNADLLGSKVMPVIPSQRSWIPNWDVRLLFILFVGLALLAFWVVRDGRQSILRWQESRYRLQKRRKHGIPDEDRRPFNVAYAAAVHLRREKEATERAQLQGEQRQARARSEYAGTQTTQFGSGLRQRAFGESSQPSSTLSFGTPLLSQSTNRGNGDLRHQQQKSASLDPLNFAERYHPSSSEEISRSATQVRFMYSRDDLPVPVQPIRKTIVDADVDQGTAGSERGKRALDEDESASLEFSKKSRVEGHDLIDGDNEVDWETDGLGQGKGSASRGYKRQANPEDDEFVESARQKGRDKRARQVSREKKPATDEQHLGDEENEDQLMDLEPTIRGKKRDRAEAGSTFGGDDDSPITEGKKASLRKRRVVGKDGAKADSRGKKRSYDQERTPDTDDEEQRPRDKARRKRGKRIVSEDEGESTDVSMDGSILVRDPSGKIHKVGEEWEANGTRWKVGPDGRCLRQTLLRKRRTKFSMPQDSQHPDSQAQMVVLVESWLTHEEYKAAEKSGDLYTPSKEPEVEEIESKPPVGDKDSPSKSGKTLLWSTSRKASLVSRKAFKDSIVTNMGLNLNPFDQPHVGYGKRVASGHIGFKTPDTESPGLRHSKSYSKWEKQDLEAEAMAKLRKRLEEQKRAASPEKSTLQLTSATPATSTFTPSTSTPTPSFAPPAATPTIKASSIFPPAPSAGPTSTGPIGSLPPLNLTPNAAATPALASAPAVKDAQLTQPSQTSTGFSFTAPNLQKPGTVQAGITQSNAFPPPWGASTSSGATAKPATQPSSVTPATTSSVPNFFGFGNQNKGSETTSTSTSAPSIPNFFGNNNTNTAKPVGTIAEPSTSSASSNIFGSSASSQPSNAQPPAATSAFKFVTTSGSQPGNVFGGGGVSTDTVTKSDQQTTQGQSAPSLMSRLGGFSAAPTANSTAASNASPFSFAAPKSTDTLNSATPSAFGDSSKQSTTTSGTSGINTATAPKFNFGFTKPSMSAPTTGPTSTDSSTPTPTATNPAPTSLFKINSTPQPAASSTASSSTTTTSAPKFSFGATTQPAQSSLTTAINNSGASNSMAPPARSKATLSFGNTNSITNPFPTAKPTGTTGNNTSSAFGNVSKAGEAPKPLFGFGSSNISTSTAATTNTPATDSHAGTSEAKPFTFNFGSGASQPTSSSSNIFGAAAAANGTKPAASSPFAFKPPASGTSPFAFGAAPKSDGNT